ncbi:magnesium-dependent phosphatase 1 [Cryptotermes secundus]|uniref:magnesium-dependent phosphatase 1 n=1 Tax=Cryptotermes secundus TaxID=105785 RepID=UPI000CD7C77F|nr:magnesium-dependent phosphatase 1 [Cryptotermes secundus]
MAGVSQKPKLIVFDLDYTLWPFWVDTHVTPPFRKDKSGNVVDATGATVKFYPEVPKVLDKLQRDGYELGVASRTGEIDGANQLLELFEWNRYFKYKEIYPGCKVTHFNQLKKQSGIALKDMLFFDDEHRNIRDLEAHGVISILVKRGVTMEVVGEGLKIYASRKNK